MGVQLVQLSWFLTHPYLYIYPVWIVFSFLLGIQMGILGIFITSENLKTIPRIIGIASLWTIMEWGRLFFFSGFTWNPVGLTLTSSIYSLQSASLWGVFGMSFWVILTNLLILKAWEAKTKNTLIASAFVALLPFIYGLAQMNYQQSGIKQSPLFSTLLVQTSFPVEEAMHFTTRQEFVDYVIQEWTQILQITKKHAGKKIDLMALPEYVVPLGTYSPVFPYSEVKSIFTSVFGEESLSALPPLEEPFAVRYQSQWFVNNAFWLQALANYFQTNLVTGLEDVDEIGLGKYHHYSAALYFRPHLTPQDRYEKRVLLPMAEYIPFECFRTLAAKYGIGGSFEPGKEAKVFPCKVPFSTSICYEETFGDLMRENRLKGAQLMVNLSNDNWYPNSKLTQQHFDHGRLRSVENGVPVIRACNTGITGGVDSLGRLIGSLGDDEALSDSLLIDIPTYHYQTLYSLTGDKLLLCFAFLGLIPLFGRSLNLK